MKPAAFRIFPALFLALLAQPLLAQSARATDITRNLDVTITIEASCTVTPNSLSLSFPTQNYTATADATATTEFQVTCSPGTPYHVALDAGLYAGPGGGVTARKMTRAASGAITAATIPYQLYRIVTGSTCATSTTVWGATQTGGTGANVLDGTGTGSQIAHTICGRVTRASIVAAGAGAYRDTVQLQLTY